MSYPPQYPPAQPQYYPPQQQPQYAPAPAPQPQYAPPAPAYYPPQQPQYAPPPPPPLPSAASIDDFFDQPAVSGKSISFKDKPPGTTYTGIVARTITRADIQVQTEMGTRQVAKHPDGRLKFTMVVPLLLQPSQEFPDGRASWYCKHNEKPELERAMEAAGCKPGTVPEQGAMITITYTGDRPVPGMSAQKMKTVTYQRPQGAGNGQAPAQPAAIQPEIATIAQPQQYAGFNGEPVPGPQQLPQQYGQPNAPWNPMAQAPQFVPPTTAAGHAPAPTGPAPAATPEPQFQAPVQQAQQFQAPPDLSPEQQALLARLLPGSQG